MSVTTGRMETVKLIECPRDAWQGLPRQIPTERKVDYLRALVAAGFGHIDAASFVSPKAVPQMSDSEEVLKQLGGTEGVEIIGIVVNEKGAERAIASGAVNTLGFPFSISSTRSCVATKTNRPRKTAPCWRPSVTGRATPGWKWWLTFRWRLAIPTMIRGAKPRCRMRWSFISGLGIACVSMADTVGTAPPELVERVVGAVTAQVGNIEVGVHLHSTRAGAAAKVLAAYDAGCRRFDAAIGGLGGCPFAQDDLIGNIPTEEVVRSLSERAVKLPIAAGLETLTRLSATISDEFGKA